ncbi:MAG: ribonuclease HII [Coriobacteriia bacterium]|nr:ribonuclease HII [Coriobacteriia bacterium]
MRVLTYSAKCKARIDKSAEGFRFSERFQEAGINSQELIAIIKAAGSDELEQLVLRYEHDPRIGVRRALSIARRKTIRQENENKRLNGLYARLDKEGPSKVIVGVDEVGRGALAGPLLVAAVIIPAKPRILGLDDSKQLQPKERERLAGEIRKTAISLNLAQVEASFIDRFGMGMAMRQAVTQVLSEVESPFDVVLLDGNPLGVHPKEEAIVHGDRLEAPIAAASIVAKVIRDNWMTEAESLYPGYHFAANKGYASPEHIAALHELGASDYHRKTFLTGILNSQTSLF